MIPRILGSKLNQFYFCPSLQVITLLLSADYYCTLPNAKAPDLYCSGIFLSALAINNFLELSCNLSNFF